MKYNISSDRDDGVASVSRRERVITNDPSAVREQHASLVASIVKQLFDSFPYHEYMSKMDDVFSSLQRAMVGASIPDHHKQPRYGRGMFTRRIYHNQSSAVRLQPSTISPDMKVELPGNLIYLPTNISRVNFNTTNQRVHRIIVK